MSDIFREVDEEVRQDQVQLWLARYWGWLLVAGLLVVAGVGGWRAFDYWRTQQQQAAGGTYLDALKLTRDGKADDAIKLLDGLATTGTPGYRQLARLRAAAETGLKDPAAGAKAYDAVAADGAVDPALQDVARLRAAALLLDTLDPKGLQTRLEPLADTNSALRNPARELLALAAIGRDDPVAANRYLDAIVIDRAATPAARQRATAFQALVKDAAAASPAPSSAPALPPAAATP